MPCEGEDAVDNDLESDNLQISFSKDKLDLIQTQDKGCLEIIEADSPSNIDKSKLLNYQRCSNRITKRLKQDLNPADPIIKTIGLKQAISSVSSRTRRPWELWSVEDKNSFFEALCEYGKDFESIQSYIAQRSKKKGAAANMIKNKDQVRHFYYRTWHKISKFLEISECVRKQTQELYGLVNYAEWRKKVGGCLSEKNRQKLNELVFTGVTTVKHKGKKLRIKTPVCRALKKLNNVSDTKEPETTKLPREIFVEFRPHTNVAWQQVQNLAQNPRVRLKVCLQKRVGSVIEYLQKRWKPYRLKRKEHIFTSLPYSLPEETLCDNSPILRVKPADDAKIYPLALSVLDIASSSDLCLETYMKLSHKKPCKDENIELKTKKGLCLNQKMKCDQETEVSEAFTEKTSTSPENTPDCNDNCSHSIDMQEMSVKKTSKNNLEEVSYINVLTPPKSVPDELSDQSIIDGQKSLPLLSTLLETTNKATASSPEKQESFPELNFRTYDSESDKAIESSYIDPHPSRAHEMEIDFDQPGKESDSKDKDSDNIFICDLISQSKKTDNPLLELVQEQDKCSLERQYEVAKDESHLNDSDSIYNKAVRSGWTVEESGFLTFGELYLLLGKPTKIVLEYEFEPTNSYCLETTQSNYNVLAQLLAVAQNYFLDAKSRQVLGKHRNYSKTTKMKLYSHTDKSSKDSPFLLTNVGFESSLVSRETGMQKTYPTSIDNSASSNDKHVFAIPAAPRTVKPADQSSLKEEIGKLLPSTRRGCRVRRKPLVVQRPLLPREGMPRPVTFVHFMPSIPSITSTVTSNCTKTENKLGVPPAKKVLQVLPTGMPMDVHPIQVPIIKQMHTEQGQNLLFQPNVVSATHVTVNSPSVHTMHVINDQNVSCVDSSIACTNSVTFTCKNQLSTHIPADSETESSSPVSLDILNLGILSESQKSSISPDDTFVTMHQMSILDASNCTLSNIMPTVGPPFLEEHEISANNKLQESSLTSSCYNEDTLSTPKRNSPESPAQPFRINSPEIQWFNGESTELSFNTFLNSVEASKPMPTTPSSSLSTENTNLDPIARLAPVVDSQVRCLLDECSIDFITKFEDLADVINDSPSK